MSPNARRTEPPPTIDIGSVVRLRELRSLAQALNITVYALTSMLRTIHVPILYIGSGSYVSELTLELAFMCLTMLRSPSYASPGSRAKTYDYPDPSLYPHDLPPGFPSDDLIHRAVKVYSSVSTGKRRRAIAALADLIRDRNETALDKRYRTQEQLRYASLDPATVLPPLI